MNLTLSIIDGDKYMEGMHLGTAEMVSPLTKTVLIVEDDPDIGEVLVQVIEEELAYQVILVQDGVSAFKVIGVTIPDLILLDYLLPGIDGLTCVERFRSTNGLEQTPILFMSANLPARAKARTDLLLIEKPFDIDHVLSQMKQLLETEATSRSCG